MELGPFLLVGALIAGIVGGERSGIAVANAVLIVGAGALGAAWFTRPPRRGVLAAIACALLGCAVMGRALDGQARSPFQAAIERREQTTLNGEATSDPSGPAYEASVLIRFILTHFPGLDLGRLATPALRILAASLVMGLPVAWLSSQLGPLLARSLNKPRRSPIEAIAVVARPTVSPTTLPTKASALA